jgi:hypothetical protein
LQHFDEFTIGDGLNMQYFAQPGQIIYEAQRMDLSKLAARFAANLERQHDIDGHLDALRKRPDYSPTVLPDANLFHFAQLARRGISLNGAGSAAVAESFIALNRACRCGAAGASRSAALNAQKPADISSFLRGRKHATGRRLGWPLASLERRRAT